jgi:hypothetical protein
VNRWEGVVRLNAADALTFASDEWQEGARAQGALEGEIVGRPFCDFVADQQMVPLYDLVFRRVRATGHPLCVPFRCDTSEERRHMEMDVVALGDGVLECRTRTVLVERVLASDRPGPAPAGTFLTLCGWCNKVKLPDGGWADLETAAAMQLTLYMGAVPRLSHGICPCCREAQFPALGLAR